MEESVVLIKLLTSEVAEGPAYLHLCLQYGSCVFSIACVCTVAEARWRIKQWQVKAHGQNTHTPSIICLFLISASSQVAFCLYDSLPFPFSFTASVLYFLSYRPPPPPPPRLSLLSSLGLFYVQRSSSVNTQISTSITISNQSPPSPCAFPKQHVLFRFVRERVYSVRRTQLYPIGWYIIVDSCNVLYKAASFVESSL